jgi:peroxiredoxin
MSKVQIDQPAPDFTLTDFRGRQVRLSDFRDKQPVVLVFNRSFM